MAVHTTFLYDRLTSELFTKNDEMRNRLVQYVYYAPTILPRHKNNSNI